MGTPLSQEARQHPDVREVYPHLVGRRGTYNRAAKYDRDEVLALFRAAWGDEPFLPVRTVFTKGSREWVDWKSKAHLKAFESGEVGLMPSERRSGVDSTIRWLAFEGLPAADWTFEGPLGDDRVFLALSAMLHELGKPYIQEEGHIIAAIVTKLDNTVFDRDRQWHHRCSSFVPWCLDPQRSDLQMGLYELRDKVHTLADLIGWLVKVLKNAQSLGTLVHVIGHPPEGQEDKLRGDALEATRTALALMEQGEWSEASSLMHGIKFKLDQAWESARASARHGSKPEGLTPPRAGS